MASCVVWWGFFCIVLTAVLIFFCEQVFDFTREVIGYCKVIINRCEDKMEDNLANLAFISESLKVNRLLPRSGYKSCLEVGGITGVIDLPRGDEIFDIVGAEVTAENRLRFNDGVANVGYKVSMPNGASVRRTKYGRISLKKHGVVYTIKRSGYRRVSMFSFTVYSLDRSLRWYLDGAEIEFPKDGNVSLVTAPVGYMIRLFGYDSENCLCDGVVIRVV